MTDREDNLIDDELRRAFTPPPAQRFAAMAQQASDDVRSWRRWWLAPLLAAAAVLAIAWSTDFWRADRMPDNPRDAGAMLVAAFDDAVNNGFGAGGCCTEATNFASQCKQLCGRALSFAAVADDVEMLGCYCGRELPGCIGLLLQVRGDPVAVFVMPKDEDPKPVLAERDDLLLERRELGPIVLYSIAFDRRSEALSSFTL